MAAAGSFVRSRWPAYGVLAVVFLVAVGVFAQNAYDTFDLLLHARDYARPPFFLGDANWGAVGVQPEAQAAGLRFGDAVHSVNGRPIDGFVVYYGALRRARPGDRLQVRVRAPGENTSVRDLSIALQAYQSASDPPAGFAIYLGTALRVVALPMLCLTLGFWVAAARIGDRSAWLFLILMISLPATYGAGMPQTMFGREHALQVLVASFTVLSAQVALPTLMLFGIAFPHPLSLDRRFPWLKWIVAGYLYLVAALVTVAVALWLHHVDRGRDLTGRAIILLTGLEGDFGAAVGGLAVVICAASLGWKAFTAPSPDARRRLTLLFAGAVPGLAALIVLIVANRLEYALPSWTLLPIITMLLAFPLTMAYVIVVHRAMDVRVVIRQGLQYLLARGGIRAIQLVLLAGVTIGATAVLSGGAGFARVAAVIAGMIAIVAIGGRFTDRLRRWVDRRFFREAYEADAILSDLAMQVRTIIETGPLLETVVTRIARSLHVPRVAILLDGAGAFRPAYALGYHDLPDLVIPPDGITVARLRKHPHTRVELDDQDSWVRAAAGDERRALDALGPELLLPLSLNEKILGIISLGPKQSEEPFSTTDIRLLDSVAAQTGLALENGRLSAAVAAEVAARAKQTRDIEIARDVQQRLFPQHYPPVPGLDYAGGCRAALGVGGDYYDFIDLSPTHLGIAIGDVSGKGIPASLLMASLRAFLRGAQTVHRQTDLTEVMRNLNKLVYESSDFNRYATFFYGELDLAARTLTYVNAGHNPPLLFRDGDVRRLDAGGPVIGLIEECVYEQATVPLAAGDVLVAYTDGVSEAMNAADEEWGEDRLIAAVRPHEAESARTLIDRLMAAADAFVAGAPQHDDMTLLVVRLL